MSEFRKTSPDDLYFFTLTIVGWIDIFTRKDYLDIIIESFKYCQEKEGLEIYAYVIMSNHLHMIARRKERDLAELLGRFKSYTAKRILNAIKLNPQESRKDWLLFLYRYFAKKNKQYSLHHFWQYTNHPTILYSAKVINQKEEYIHNNPVRAGLVTHPHYWLYSSACRESPLKTLAL